MLSCLMYKLCIPEVFVIVLYAVYIGGLFAKVPFGNLYMRLVTKDQVGGHTHCVIQHAMVTYSWIITCISPDQPHRSHITKEI